MVKQLSPKLTETEGCYIKPLIAPPCYPSHPPRLQQTDRAKQGAAATRHGHRDEEEGGGGEGDEGVVRRASQG
jgi:hypothetical protein